MRQPFAGLTALFSGALLTLLTATAAAPAADAELTKVGAVEGIQEYRLANGLQVLLFRDPSTPRVTVNLTVLVGSRHEGYGETGMAHLLEHMLFKGTPTHPDVPGALKNHGAQFNGTTWTDRTNYFETMPATDENLEFGLKLEADRLVNSFVKREDLLSEMTVVRNEFERGENDPSGILSQRMMSAAYNWHNYGKSTIGNRSDIERVPIENLQAFYRKYYRPDNAVLVIAGRFDEQKALEYVKKYFGPLKKPATPVEKTYTEEPAQDGERNVTLRRVGDVAVVGAVYHIPAGSHPDFAAVQIMVRLLVDEPSGVLYQALVKPKIANSVSGAAFAWHDPGVVQLSASCTPDKLDACKEALLTTLDKFAAGKMDEKDVKRAKLQYLRFNERLLDDPNQLAVRLSESAALGDWRLFFLSRDRVEKVTAADVQRVAEQFLKRSNRTVGTFVPTKAPERTPVPETPAVAEALKDYKGGDAVQFGEEFDPTPANIDARTKKVEAGTVPVALLAKKTRGEVVRLRLNLRFGNAESLVGKKAICEAIGEMLQRGTAKRSRQDIADDLLELAANVGVSTDVGQMTVTLQTRRKNLPAAMKLLKEILREPTFPAEELELYKRELLEELDKAKTEPTSLASRYLQRKLAPFPKDTVRYVPTLEEEIAEVQALTPDKLKELYTKQVGGTDGEGALVGDFDPDEATALLKDLLAGWKAETPYKRIERPAALDVAGGKEVIRTPDKANALYLAGVNDAVSDADPEYAALEVGNFLLGAAPLASRLSNRVRGKEGLSYTVRSEVTASIKDKNGRYRMYAICNPGNMPKVEKAMAEELEKFLKEGPSVGELEEAKAAYLKKLRVERAQDATLASQLVSNLYAGRTFVYQADLEKRIAALTPDEVKAAFLKAVPIDRLVIVEAGDFKP